MGERKTHGPESPLAYRVHLSYVSQVPTSSLVDRANTNPLPAASWEVSTGPAGQKVTGNRTKDGMTSRSLSYLRKIKVAQCTLRERAARDRWSQKQVPDTGLRKKSVSNFIWVS